ncbi:MAG: hypothetical protein EZS28_018753 [Streblomastix strix]|uniref:DNA-directed DNA polymerase n=2 Tax=Streblomastix strix TaxID=222440 RepID=A0A5J4VTG2_9EUKA|nr:MAG: hypothetical protein EZS28_018753 [Streblomastix strix]
MSACANAIKYALAYWDFKLDQDYTPKDDYAPFILTQNYWNIKVQNYLEQDKRRNRDTSNNIKESDCAFYRKLFLSTGCHICKARFTSKNPPTLDRINNNMGHSADNHDRFNPFVKEFMSQRIQAINEKNNGKKQFYKQAMNSSYGTDGMNQEKYQQTKLLSSDRTWLSHLQAFDMNRMHYICGDTDSMTWAISGNPDAEEGYRQKFKYVIKDQEFFDENYPLFFGQYKQLLGVSYEAEGTACIALAPKIHYIYNPLPNENEKDYNYL